MTQIVIPSSYWLTPLVEAVRNAQPGDCIVVPSEITEQVAKHAMLRLGRQDLSVLIQPPIEKQDLSSE